MAAPFQVENAPRALRFIEQAVVRQRRHTTYGEITKALGLRKDHIRAIGQVVSRIDAACFYADLPFLVAAKVRHEDGRLNDESFSSPPWDRHRQALVTSADNRNWTSADFSRIRSALDKLPNKSATLIWEDIDELGALAIQKSLASAGLSPQATNTSLEPRQSRPWTREEVLKAISLYCTLPFGRFHKSNPDVIALAQILNRTPGSVALKLSNLASLDPNERARGISGMSNASALDRQVWAEFYGRWDELATALPDQLPISDDQVPNLTIPSGPTATTAIQQVRRGQQFFRKAVLSAYSDRCCITGIAEPRLLRASHIVPWSESEEHRLNPCNGLCLNSLHDAAFDAGLITLDKQLRLVLARQLSKKMPKPVFAEYFERHEGQGIKLPERFQPDEKLLQIHRETQFVDAIF